MKKNRIIALLASCLFTLQFPLTVMAAVEANIEYGDVIIGATQVTYTPSAGVDAATEDHGGAVTVTGTSTEYTVTVDTTSNPVPGNDSAAAEVPSGPIAGSSLEVLNVYLNNVFAD